MEHKAALFIEYKNLLFSIAYNMLGSVDSAEDMVQETFLKWMETQEGTVRHAKAYLVRIVTNKCINYLNSARVQREEYIGVWLPEPLVNYDNAREHARIETYHALSIGVMVLLEKLTPQERAIFLLKEIFAYDYYELAGIFDKSEDNCRQIFKRAKDNLGRDTQRFEVDLRVHEKMLNKLLQATAEGNLDDLIALLKEDIVLFADGGGKFIQVKEQRLTAAYKPIHGRENVCRLILSTMSKLYQLPEFHQEVIIANGLPSFVSYLGDTPISIFSMETDGEQIRHIYIQTNPDKLKQFSQ